MACTVYIIIISIMNGCNQGYDVCIIVFSIEWIYVIEFMETISLLHAAGNKFRRPNVSASNSTTADDIENDAHVSLNNNILYVVLYVMFVTKLPCWKCRTNVSNLIIVQAIWPIPSCRTEIPYSLTT